MDGCAGSFLLEVKSLLVTMHVLGAFSLMALSTLLTVQARCGSLTLLCIPPISILPPGAEIRLPPSKTRLLVVHLRASATSALQKNNAFSVTATRGVTPENCETGKGATRFD
jgi:hypothetical protein